MSNIDQNLSKALEHTRNAAQESAYNHAALMTICDSLSEISKALKDIKTALDMTELSNH